MASRLYNVQAGSVSCKMHLDDQRSYQENIQYVGQILSVDAKTLIQISRANQSIPSGVNHKLKARELGGSDLPGDISLDRTAIEGRLSSQDAQLGVNSLLKVGDSNSADLNVIEFYDPDDAGFEPGYPQNVFGSSTFPDKTLP